MEIVEPIGLTQHGDILASSFAHPFGTVAFRSTLVTPFGD